MSCVKFLETKYSIESVEGSKASVYKAHAKTITAKVGCSRAEERCA